MPCRRPETEADAPFLFALFAACQDAAFAYLDPELRACLLRQSFDGQRATYRQRYPGARFDIVALAGEAVGRIVTDRGADAVTLVDLALMPERRGRGIGSGLIRDLLAEAASAGLPVKLSVRNDDAGAHRLYARHGFTIVARSETDALMRWVPSRRS